MPNNQINNDLKPLGQFGYRRGERSFSLLETIVAVSLVAILMVEVSGVHGNSIAFNEYGRKVLQASYLAKRLMAQVEYQASIHSPLKDIAISEKEKPFDDAPDFSYSITVEPLPHVVDLMFKIFSGGLAPKKDGDSEKADSSGAGAVLEQIKGVVTQSVGDDPIWIAKVDVSWAEGARRANTSLAMIVTDTKKLEESVGKILDAAPVPASSTGTAVQPAGGQPAGGQPAGGQPAGGQPAGGQPAGGQTGTVPP